MGLWDVKWRTLLSIDSVLTYIVRILHKFVYCVDRLRFRAKIEFIKPDKLDAGTTIKGLDYIDVPGLTTRDYKLNFHSHKECQPLIKVS